MQHLSRQCIVLLWFQLAVQLVLFEAQDSGISIIPPRNGTHVALELPRFPPSSSSFKPAAHCTQPHQSAASSPSSAHSRGVQENSENQSREGAEVKHDALEGERPFQSAVASWRQRKLLEGHVGSEIPQGLGEQGSVEAGGGVGPVSAPGEVGGDGREHFSRGVESAQMEGRIPGDCRAGDGTPEEQADVYLRDTYQFWNDADFAAMRRLAGAFKKADLCNEGEVVLVGGVNEGQLAKSLLDSCPLVVHGVEIQPDLVAESRRILASYPSATVHHIGWSRNSQRGVRVAGLGGYGGLYSAQQLASAVRPDGRPHILAAVASSALSGEDVLADTVSMNEWVRDSLHIRRALYVAIDAEGHEAPIIEGMQLDQVDNRRRFSAFQFELGGTWAARDPRKAQPSWSQVETARFLDFCGYDLYLIGRDVYLRIHPDMLRLSAVLDEGFGPFVQGNILALHRSFGHPALQRLVSANLLRPRRELCPASARI